MYTALRAATKTFAAFLNSALIDDAELATLFDPGAGGTMVVSSNTPDDMSEAGKQGLSLWLYRVSRDEQRLNDPPLRPSLTQQIKAPLPMKLHYLVTPIVALDSANPEVSSDLQQVLAGKVLQIFHDNPVFRADLLKDTLAGSDTTISMRLENMSMEDLTRLMSGQRKMNHLCLAYEAAVVNIDSAQDPRVVVPVATYEPRIGLIRDVRAAE